MNEIFQRLINRDPNLSNEKLAIKELLKFKNAQETTGYTDSLAFTSKIVNEDDSLAQEDEVIETNIKRPYKSASPFFINSGDDDLV